MYKIFFVINFFFFILYDFYNPSLGGRPFDIIGILFLLGLSLLVYFPKNKLYFNLKHLVFIILNTLYWLFMIVLGLLFEQNFLAAFAFFCGAFMVLPLFYLFGIKYQNKLLAIFNILLIISLALFLVQYFVFKLSGYPIRYHSFGGFTPSRIYNEDLNYFRGSGIYQEPSEFSKASFLILVLRGYINKASKFDLLAILGLISILLSNSLWGIGGLIFYIIYFSKSLIIRSLLIISIISIGSILLANPELIIKTGLLTDRTILRLQNPENDNSTQDRMGLNTSNHVDYLTFFGHGLSTSSFQDYRGANGFSFYIYSFGILGFLLLILSIFFWGKNTIPLILSLFYLLTAFPHFSYMITWAWLGLCLSQISYNNANFKSQRFLVQNN